MAEIRRAVREKRLDAFAEDFWSRFEQGREKDEGLGKIGEERMCDEGKKN